MIIQVQAVEVENAGKYYKAKVAFTNNGKASRSTVVSFGDGAPAFESIKGATPGSWWDVNLVKEGAYWNWVSATPTDPQFPNAEQSGTSAATSGYVAKSAAPAAKGNWETSEEREARQHYIVRQSSIANAVEYLNHNKKNYEVGELLSLADSFEKFVFRTGIYASNQSFSDMTSDIPV